MLIRSVCLILLLFCHSFAIDILEIINIDRKLSDSATPALENGIRFFHSISIRGGYVYYYSLDLQEKWGEGRTDEYTIEVQPPGTPAVGMSLLRAYQVTKNEYFLQAAQDAAKALIWGQNDLGGWEHKIHFNLEKRNRVSFDDNQTQSVIRFLMALDQEMDDDSLSMAIEKALALMLTSQLPNGGWPHEYPEQGNYHDYVTFNDRGINDCIDVMIDAHRFYGKAEYRKSLQKAGRFMMISQLPPPQPGWAQQYNEFLQPAWARSFEPPSVCPLVTIRNINTLIDLYLYSRQAVLLEPVPDALRWLQEVRLPNGKWPRFVELWTNKPLYYDRGRIRVQSTDELHIERRSGYSYESDLAGRLEDTVKRFNEVKELGAVQYLDKQNKPLSKAEAAEKLRALEPLVHEIIKAQDTQGRWITQNDRYRKIIPGMRWEGEYIVKDRIHSAVFNHNVSVLCEYLATLQLLNTTNQ